MRTALAGQSRTSASKSSSKSSAHEILRRAAGGGVGNPLPIPIAIGGGAGPTSRLKKLDVHDCFSIGTDVHAWLRERVEEFMFTEPALINHRYVVSYSDDADDYDDVGVVFS